MSDAIVRSADEIRRAAEACLRICQRGRRTLWDRIDDPGTVAQIVEQAEAECPIGHASCQHCVPAHALAWVIGLDGCDLDAADPLAPDYDT